MKWINYIEVLPQMYEKNIGFKKDNPFLSKSHFAKIIFKTKAIENGFNNGMHIVRFETRPLKPDAEERRTIIWTLEDLFKQDSFYKQIPLEYIESLHYLDEN